MSGEARPVGACTLLEQLLAFREHGRTTRPPVPAPSTSPTSLRALGAGLAARKDQSACS